MKDKTSITLMVGTSPIGKKSHFLYLGNQKKSECFKLIDGARTLLPYKNQENAWFDQKITLWRILIFFLVISPPH